MSNRRAFSGNIFLDSLERDQRLAAIDTAQFQQLASINAMAKFGIGNVGAEAAHAKKDLSVREMLDAAYKRAGITRVIA